MAIQSVTRYVPSRSASLRSGSESDAARVPVSLARVAILEREGEDDRPRWKGRPQCSFMDDSPDLRRFIRPAPAIGRAPPLPRKPVVKAVRIYHTYGIASARFQPQAWSQSFGDCVWAEPKYSVAQLIALAAKVSGVSVDEMKCPRHHHTIVRARWLAAWLLMKFTRHSIAAIGRHIGGKDHSTICNARDRVARAVAGQTLPEKMPDYAEAVWDVLRGLK